MSELNELPGLTNRQKIRNFFNSSYKVIDSSKLLIKLIKEYMDEKDENRRRSILESITKVQSGR